MSPERRGKRTEKKCKSVSKVRLIIFEKAGTIFVGCLKIDKLFLKFTKKMFAPIMNYIFP